MMKVERTPAPLTSASHNPIVKRKKLQAVSRAFGERIPSWGEAPLWNVKPLSLKRSALLLGLSPFWANDDNRSEAPESPFPRTYGFALLPPTFMLPNGSAPHTLALGVPNPGDALLLTLDCRRGQLLIGRIPAGDHFQNDVAHAWLEKARSALEDPLLEPWELLLAMQHRLVARMEAESKDLLSALVLFAGLPQENAFGPLPAQISQLMGPTLLLGLHFDVITLFQPSLRDTPAKQGPATEAARRSRLPDDAPERMLSSLTAASMAREIEQWTERMEALGFTPTQAESMRQYLAPLLLVRSRGHSPVLRQDFRHVERAARQLLDIHGADAASHLESHLLQSYRTFHQSLPEVTRFGTPVIPGALQMLAMGSMGAPLATIMPISVAARAF